MKSLLLTKKSLAPVLLSFSIFAGCANVDIVDNSDAGFNDDFVCSGGDCPDGLLSSELAALINERRARIADEKAASSGQKVSQSPQVTVQEIQQIARKPPAEKTDRDREIEALIEELLQQRRERQAGKAQTN